MPNKKASILIMSVIITGIVLLIALSVSLGSIRNRKASIGASGTTAAFQKAETGIERVLDIIRNNQDKLTLSDIVWPSGLSCVNRENYATITSNYGYEVQLKGENDAIVTRCDSTPPSDIKNIKAIGTAEGSQRAIEAAVAAASACWPIMGGYIAPGAANSKKIDQDWTVVFLEGSETVTDGDSAGGFIYKKSDGTKNYAIHVAASHKEGVLSTANECASGSSYSLCVKIDSNGNPVITTLQNMSMSYMVMNCN